VPLPPPLLLLLLLQLLQVMSSLGAGLCVGFLHQPPHQQTS
jgi:hypothetical protein